MESCDGIVVNAKHNVKLKRFMKCSGDYPVQLQYLQEVLHCPTKGKNQAPKSTEGENLSMTFTHKLRYSSDRKSTVTAFSSKELSFQNQEVEIFRISVINFTIIYIIIMKLNM
jgi:hypothetical protein